jgi:hypothetical protein
MEWMSAIVDGWAERRYPPGWNLCEEVCGLTGRQWIRA